MLFSNPVKQLLIRPPGSPRILGSFRVTQDFGPTSLLQEPSMTWPGGEGIPAKTYAHFHRGIDLGNGKCGAAVLATQAGIVTIAGKGSDGAIRVIIDHGGGFVTWSYHLADKAVYVGNVVKTGQLIGHVGSTGNSTACHLHFVVRKDGKYVDPWRRLRQNVRIRPSQGVAAPIRIRSALTLDKASIFAEANNGQIIRTDGVDLGSAATWRDWDGDVTGPEYPDPNGNASTRWSRMFLDTAYRYIAGGYAELSQT